MNKGLFRPEAVKNQSAKLEGKVVIAHLLASKVVLMTLLGVVCVAIVFLISSSFHRKTDYGCIVAGITAAL